MVGLRRINPTIPAALVVVLLGTVLVWLLGLSERGVAIVGVVPAGIPAPALPALDWAAVRGLWVEDDEAWAKKLFVASLIYLTALFAALIVDAL